MIRKLWIGIALTIFLGSCLEELGEIDEFGEVTLSPKVAFPILDSELKFTDFDDNISKFSISTQEDGTIVLNYEENLTEAVAEDYFNIGNQTAPEVLIIGLSSGGTPLNGTMTAEDNGVLNFSVEDELRIDQLNLKSGIVRLVVNSTYQVDTKATFSITELNIGGQPFESEVVVTPGNTIVDVDISGAMLDLTRGGTTFNELEYTLSVELTGNGNIVLPAESISGYFQLVDPVFSLILGEGGYRVIDDRMGSETISVLEAVDVGFFFLAEPSLDLIVSNGFGVPVEIDLVELKIKDREGNESLLSGDVVDIENPFLIEAPTVVQMGERVETTISFNHTNSNIPDLISQIPSEISYEASAIYPGGSRKIFVQDTSTIRVDARVEVPLFGSLMDFVFRERFEINGADIEVVNNAVSRISTGTHTPLTTGLQLIFRDELDNVILELLTDNPLITVAAAVDAEGNSIDEMQNELTIAISQDDIEKLKNLNELEVILTMETTDAGTKLVRIKDSDYLKLKVSIEGQLQIGE